MATVTIERIAAGGDGVARLEDGMVVFVPRTVPGDVVEIELVQRKARFARGRAVRLASAGPGRADPGCPHYLRDRCGGCQLQHVSPEVQRAVKGALVGDALRRIGKRDAADPAVVPSPRTWRYRRKVTLAARDGRIGLHPYHEPDQVFDLEDCRITGEELMGLWAKIRTAREHLPAALESLVLKEDRAGGRHVVTVGGDEPWEPGPLARAVGDDTISYWWQPSRGAARVLLGPSAGYPALAFEQVNPELASRIRSDAVEALGDVRERVVWDLYCGVGDTAELLVARGARVYGVDVDRGAIEYARGRGERGNAMLIAARCEEALHRLPVPDAVILNPPRTGVHARVSQRLEQWAAGHAGARVGYLSCDPATLARDLARIPSLTLRDTRAYDLFPHTSHVETLAVLEAA